MKIVVFGLSISSAWGNGHATLLRGLFRVLHAGGHELHFFERDTEYYSAHRDVTSLSYATLHLYNDWEEASAIGRHLLSDADVAMVTSYCPDGAAACRLILGFNPRLRTVFYDMDTPITLDRLARNEIIPYLPSEGLSEFDLVLSYTGGAAIEALRRRLGAKRIATLYGWVDPELYFTVPSCPELAADLSYLGTYAIDRQPALDTLLLEPARQLSGHRFLIGGAMYPNPESWPANVRHYEHVAPPKHTAFYSSSPLTLSVTRSTMAAMGYCPSGRLFEAAACGTAVLSDWWEGLDTFFLPGEEILLAGSSTEVVHQVTRDHHELTKVGKRARERALDCHTAAVRANRFVDLIENPDLECESDELSVSATER